MSKYRHIKGAIYSDNMSKFSSALLVDKLNSYSQKIQSLEKQVESLESLLRESVNLIDCSLDRCNSCKCKSCKFLDKIKQLEGMENDN